MNQTIFLYLTVFLAIIIISSNILSLLSFTKINAQIADVYVNNTTPSEGTSIIISGNQTQIPKMNPCLNMMNPGMMTMYAYNNITGSLKLDPILNNTISQIKISLSQAATTAEHEIGNNSHAIEAYLCDANGYLVYMIWLRGQNTDTTDVIIDPANDKVLLKNSNLFPQQKSMDNHMMMSGMHEMNH
jgi:hypothetical protein